MVKIKCVKLECPVCHVVGSAQLFLNKNNQVRYCRVRHYKGLNEFKKPQFTYHRINDLSILKTLLENQGFQFQTATGQDGQTTKVITKFHDHVVNNSGLKQQSKCLGSLAWWGTALVRRWSRDQSPPEAPFQLVCCIIQNKKRFCCFYNFVGFQDFAKL